MNVEFFTIVKFVTNFVPAVFAVAVISAVIWAFCGQSAAFGARSASVLTKTTAVFAALFLVIAFSLALLNKAPASDVNLLETAEQVEGTVEEAASTAGSWLDE